ncbi:MAG: hypothetical protein ISR40_06980, partial [Puniceicoccaceae bacterium]|nr:hypothetical protein [Puniceicoccaceae bacterium]
MPISAHSPYAKHSLYHGVCTEARAPLLYALAQGAESTTSVVLVSEPRRAQELAAEVDSYVAWADKKSPLEVLHFPEDPPPDIDAQRRADRICDRLAVLTALLTQSARKRLLIVTPEALLGRCPAKAAFEKQRLSLKVGQSYPFSELIESLTSNLDYDSEALCEQPGQIATRGGLIDIYPYDAHCPYRIDFFGDEIESIRSFDPTTQRTEKPTQVIHIAAAESAASVHSQEGGLLDYFMEQPLQWALEDPALLVREHPYRFEKINSTHGAVRSFHQVLKIREKVDTLTCICELDTDPELFRGAERIELSTEPTANYRFQSDTAQIGYDRFESEQSAR